MTDKHLKVLAIDTATPVCSVALVEGGGAAGECTLYGQKNHSEKLLSLIDGLLAHTGVSPQDIDLIAVSSGPGSFTGLRVGISTAQGMALSLGKDLRAVSTLEVLAFQAALPREGYVCPMIDARKQQVYTCLYYCGGDGRLEKRIADTVVAPEDWLSALPGPAVFVGCGASRYREVIADAAQDHIVLADFLGSPRASVLARVAVQAYLCSGKNLLEEVVPLYIRAPDAQRHGCKPKGSFSPVR